MSFLRNHWHGLVGTVHRFPTLHDKLIQQIDNKRVSDLESRKLNSDAKALQIGFVLLADIGHLFSKYDYVSGVREVELLISREYGRSLERTEVREN